MSDVCYNCYHLHLPGPCKQVLTQCTTCHSLGHEWMFCHLGVGHNRQTEHKYRALCHNCRSWHLPEPCPQQAVKCTGCGQFGHQREYCPLDPRPGDLFLQNMNAALANGLPGAETLKILHNTGMVDALFDIKMGAVRDTLVLLANGHSGESARRYLADIYRGAPRHSDTNTPSAAPGSQNTGHQSLHFPSIPQQAPQVNGVSHPHQQQSNGMQQQLISHQANTGGQATQLPMNNHALAQGVNGTSSDMFTAQNEVKLSGAQAGIENFRTFEVRADASQRDVFEVDSSGNAIPTPASSLYESSMVEGEEETFFVN